MIRIMAKAQHLVVMKGAALTSGSVGERCEFIFDSAWDGLTKAAVFTAGEECHTVLLTRDSCEVPWECLKMAFIPLTVAVYGHRGTRRVLASDYAELQITEGAEPEDDETTDPTLAVWAQLQAYKQDLLTDEDKQEIANLAPQEVFVAEYGVTTMAQIYAAYQQGQFVVCKMNGRLFMPLTNILPFIARFGHAAAGVMYTADCTNSGWQYDERSLQNALTAGENITINRTTGVISATGGGSYDDTELRGRIEAIEGKEATWNAKASAASVSAVSGRVTVIEGKEAGWDAKASADSVTAVSGRVTVIEGKEAGWDAKASADSVTAVSDRVTTLETALTGVDALADDISEVVGV